ncbi:hypothetical protein PSTG_13681 [Puccinia striiformis f. sp. tritici PST-78]|uniref:Uncharacterized protein n=1 Tax=Puccinia striiformis f. sp. tritici PST-78 TaxID=1165861 RepID=A0A0L0V1B4_9BASI|nr:hypothetical protein PSTG_13681 [Puccinia striiformis f. sp. tritici PST-78]
MAQVAISTHCVCVSVSGKEGSGQAHDSQPYAHNQLSGIDQAKVNAIITCDTTGNSAAKLVGGSRPSPPPGTFTWNEVRKAMKMLRRGLNLVPGSGDRAVQAAVINGLSSGSLTEETIEDQK